MNGLLLEITSWPSPNLDYVKVKGAADVPSGPDPRASPDLVSSCKGCPGRVVNTRDLSPASGMQLKTAYGLSLATFSP